MSVIVVAITGSAACRRAVERVPAVFADAEIVVATVMPGSRSDADADSIRAAVDRVEAEASLEMVNRACDTVGPQARALLLEGDPASALSALASNEGADAIVVGSLARDSIGGVLLGSVAAGLLDQAPCSVIELGS